LEYKSNIQQKDKFKGNYFGTGEMILNGFFEGTIKIDKLYIRESANFIGHITAVEVFVHGNVKADIMTDKLHISSIGTVEGDIIYRSLKIDEGGFLKSSKVIKMSDKSILNNKVSKK
tara:strand:+ start:1136 stop:1486 length:351 start_codon:yes stop_codon:yes gene_type:complete